MIAAALLMIAPVELAPEQPKPVEATIAAIRANPKRFDGQVVRVHGYVNRCQRLDCGIEERPSAVIGGGGERLSIASNDKFDAIVAPLLPTYVEFDARFDAACVIGLCTDRAPVLAIVSLRSLVSPEPPEIEK